jgi:membrane-bound inhibitor of C-type lysozyme
MLQRFGLALILICAGVSVTDAASAGLVLELGAPDRDFEQRHVTYDCGEETTLSATYLNAEPDFLALLTPPEEGDPMVFVAVVSASGVRYAASHWVWWTDGPEASLYDVTLGEDADPVLTCSEINNTP